MPANHRTQKAAPSARRAARGSSATSRGKIAKIVPEVGAAARTKLRRNACYVPSARRPKAVPCLATRATWAGMETQAARDCASCVSRESTKTPKVKHRASHARRRDGPGTRKPRAWASAKHALTIARRVTRPGHGTFGSACAKKTHTSTTHPQWATARPILGLYMPMMRRLQRVRRALKAQRAPWTDPHSCICTLVLDFGSPKT